MSADIINNLFTVVFQGEKFHPEEMTLAELDTLLSRVRCYWNVLTDDFMAEVYTCAAWLEILRSEGPDRDAFYGYLESKGLWLCEWCKRRVYRLERGLCDECADLHRAELAA